MRAKIDQIVLAVPDLEAALSQYKQIYDVPVTERGQVLTIGVDYARLALGDMGFELVTPISGDGPVAARLARHGPGVYLVSFVVEDFEQAVAKLRARGIQLIGDPTTGRVLIRPSEAGGLLTMLIRSSQS